MDREIAQSLGTDSASGRFGDQIPGSRQKADITNTVDLDALLDNFLLLLTYGLFNWFFEDWVDGLFDDTTPNAHGLRILKNSIHY